MKKLSVHSRRAFTLIELLATCVLLGFFLLVASQLVVTTFRAKSDAEKRDALLHRIDSALVSLRSDVWGTSVIKADGSQVDLLAPDGTPITWRAGSDGSLTRTAGKAVAPRSWKQMPAATFTSDGPLLTLHIRAAERDESLTIASQQMLQGAAR